MRRVLVIGPDFPPSGRPSALRVSFLVRHLPEFGWKPTVLTVDPRVYESPIDPESEQLLPQWLEIVRTTALPTRLTRWLGVGDVGLRALWHHWRAASHLCASRRVDLVFVSMPPYVSAVLGRLLHGRHGIPYVVDYQDPWVTAAYRRLPRAERPRKRHLSYPLSRVLEPFALRRVSHITGVSVGTTQGVVSRYKWLSLADTSEIPVGGEPADFEYLRAHPRRNPVFDRADGNKHVSYVGVCIGPMYPTLRALFEAVRRCGQREPAVLANLRMHFVGTNYSSSGRAAERVMPLAREAGLADIVDELPRRVPYLDALQILLDSHGVLVVGSDAPHYTASKVFPCILAQRPILAVVHEASSVAAIVRQTAAGEVVTYGGNGGPADRVGDIESAFERLLGALPGARPATNWDAFEPYTGRAMAGRLARALDTALVGAARP